MELVIKILAGAIPASVILSSVFVFLLCRRRGNSKNQFISEDRFRKPAADNTSFQASVARLHLSHKAGSKTSLRFHHLHHHHNQENNINHSQQQQQNFGWEHHPRLIAEAAENGWSRFVFADRSSVPRSSPLWGLCVICDGGRPPESDAVSCWEVPAGSSEFMQTVRINPTNKKNGSSNSGSTNSPLRVADESSSGNSCIRMSLPLPGPSLIGTSFPQEAYFEITILYLQSQKKSEEGSAAADGEDDRVKLIEENSKSVQAAKSVSAEKNRENFLVSLGLTRGGSPLTKSMIPGSFPGSIGFHSNGCVFLDGLKLVSESEKTGWAEVNKVIGCGFNPGKKKVFFTVDSVLVQVIRCNSDVYKSPLYPILASNSDVMVLVNLGQAAFKYAPANALRTSNPCFIRSSPSQNAGSIIGYEDSRELFSMGRIDSEWLNEAKQNKSAGDTNSKNSCRSSRKDSGNWEDVSSVVDIDGESDLFEISLQN